MRRVERGAQSLLLVRQHRAGRLPARDVAGQLVHVVEYVTRADPAQRVDLRGRRMPAADEAEHGHAGRGSRASHDPATAAIPVILCTSKSNETDRIWGLRQGAREYLTKPVKADELLAKIAQLTVA